MSLISLTPNTPNRTAGNIYPRSQFYTEVRTKWTDKWTPVNYLTPKMAVICAAPGIGYAKFLFRYGNVKMEDQTLFAQINDIDILDQYVRIKKIDPAGQTTVLWTGIIAADSLHPFGAADDLSGAGDYTVDAFSLVHLLDREAIRQVKAQEPGGNFVWIEDVPACNVLYKHGVNIYGNRSLITDPNSALDTAYAFYGNGDPALAAQWTFRDIADMICQRHVPANGPGFVLAGQASVLDKITDTVKIAGRTPWQILNDMISRNRGFGFYPNVYYGTENGGSSDLVVLSVFSILDRGVSAGGVTIPANPNVVSFDFDQSIDLDNPVIVRSTSGKFDRIEARGAPILQTFTVSYLDKTLEIGWPASAETQYQTGPTSSNADDNDNYRNSDDRLANVYKKHRVPMAFKGVVNSYGQDAFACIPSINDAGDISYDSTPFYRLGKSFEHFTPFEEGKDYSVDPPVNLAQATNSEPSFLKPFALVKDPSVPAKTFFYMVDAGAENLEVAGSSKAHFTCYPRELAIGVHGHPGYMYALNSAFNPATNPPTPPTAFNDVPVFNYTDILATVSIRCDTCVKAIAFGDTPLNGLTRTKFIDIEDAELWLAVPKTVIGVNSDGSLARYAGSGILRDDRPRLKGIAAFAAAWYGKQRSSIHFTVKRVDEIAHLGALVKATVTAGVLRQIGTCVTALSWDLDAQTTTVETQWAEIDFNIGYTPEAAATASAADPSFNGTNDLNENQRRRFKRGKTPFGGS